MSWHADAGLLERYADGRIDDPSAFSLEAHVLACEACREGLGEVADRTRLDRGWSGVVATLDDPRAGLVERGLRRLGVRHHVARLLAATPSLRVSWLGAQTLALAVAVFAANASPTARGRELARFLFLVIAAVLPVAGVFAAYGPALDPGFEVSLAAPMRSFRLLLIRASAVVATSTIIASVAALALPDLDWHAAAWTLPSVALVASGLALSTRFRSSVAFSAVALLWFAGAAFGALHADPFVLFGGAGQAISFALVIVSVLAVVRRGESFEQE